MTAHAPPLGHGTAYRSPRLSPGELPVSEYDDRLPADEWPDDVARIAELLGAIAHTWRAVRPVGHAPIAGGPRAWDCLDSDNLRRGCCHGLVTSLAGPFPLVPRVCGYVAVPGLAGESPTLCPPIPWRL